MTRMLVVTMKNNDRCFFSCAGQPFEWSGDVAGKLAMEKTIKELIAGEGNLGDLFEVYGQDWGVAAIEVLESHVAWTIKVCSEKDNKK